MVEWSVLFGSLVVSYLPNLAKSTCSLISAPEYIPPHESVKISSVMSPTDSDQASSMANRKHFSQG